MPRRNLRCLLLVTIFSLICFQRVPQSRYSRVLADAMDHVSRRFYLPVDGLKLFEGAMSGMIKQLGDEHSAYIKVVKKPAFEADLNDAEDSVQGISRGADGRWNFLLPGNHEVGYIRITGFADTEDDEKGTAADVRAALEQLRKEKVRGLVLDLRDNRGGSLRTAVAICDMLVPKGEIVTTRGREGQILQAFRASGKAFFTGLPIAVLVNRDSASAAEIVAACLQDHGLAIVVGERSYGKGTVQEVIDMGPTLGAMKLTVATYWRPSGQNINRPKNDGTKDEKNAAWGVSPDQGYEVKVDDDEREHLLSWQRQHGLAAVSAEKGPAGAAVADRVLLKAVEYLVARK